jgi:hypothetical protein
MHNDGGEATHAWHRARCVWDQSACNFPGKDSIHQQMPREEPASFFFVGGALKLRSRLQGNSFSRIRPTGR